MILLLNCVAAIPALAEQPPLFISSYHEKLTDEMFRDIHEEWSPHSLKAIKTASRISDGHPSYDVAVWHCDNADYLDSRFYDGKSYPKWEKYSKLSPKDEAHAELQSCVQNAFGQFNAAAAFAGELIDRNGKPIADAYGAKECELYQDTDNKDIPQWPGMYRPKCNTLQALGRVFHTVADLYAHSNIADAADSSQKVGVGNPPGLKLDHHSSPFKFADYILNPEKLNNLSEFSKLLPENLTTGCYPDIDRFGAVSNCLEGTATPRLTHDPQTGKSTSTGLNKDSENSPRGKLQYDSSMTNFQHAWKEAKADMADAWKAFTTRLVSQYGEARAKTIVEILKQDSATR